MRRINNTLKKQSLLKTEKELLKSVAETSTSFFFNYITERYLSPNEVNRLYLPNKTRQKLIMIFFCFRNQVNAWSPITFFFLAFHILRRVQTNYFSVL